MRPIEPRRKGQVIDLTELHRNYYNRKTRTPFIQRVPLLISAGLMGWAAFAGFAWIACRFLD